MIESYVSAVIATMFGRGVVLKTDPCLPLVLEYVRRHVVDSIRDRAPISKVVFRVRFEAQETSSTTYTIRVEDIEELENTSLARDEWLSLCQGTDGPQAAA